MKRDLHAVEENDRRALAPLDTPRALQLDLRNICLGLMTHPPPTAREMAHEYERK